MDNYQDFIQLVREVYKSRQKIIPLHEPRFSGKEKDLLNKVIESGYVSSSGEYVDLVEAAFAEFTQTNGAVAVVNGTSALQLALRLVGVENNTEVITQALTFVATANSISYNGAVPIFLDVDYDSMGLSPKALIDFLDSEAEVRNGECFNSGTGRRISACVPMHTFGLIGSMEEIRSICNKWKIPIVEDAAEALGSTLNNNPAGSFGETAAFSFNGNKIITCGGGGVVVSNNKDLASYGKYLSTTAKVPHDWEYFHDVLGYNFRMPNINAALLIAQFEKLPGFMKEKEKLYEKYRSFYSSSEAILRGVPKGCKWNHWLISVELEGKEQRDLFLEKTNSEGILTRPIWQLMFRLPMYKDCQRDDQVNAQLLEERIVNIPSSVPV